MHKQREDETYRYSPDLLYFDRVATLKTLAANLPTSRQSGVGSGRVFRQLFGRQVNHLVVVSEYKDWNGFVKVRSDPEFSQLVERIRGSANPAADLVGADVYEELTI